VNTTVRSGQGQKNISYDLLSLPLYLVERIHDVAAQYHQRSQSTD
jgi:hypothetical protein